MPLFNKTELKIVDALVAGKSLKKLGGESNITPETLNERLEELKSKLDAKSASDIPERFKSLTGWSGKPSDYPH